MSLNIWTVLSYLLERRNEEERNEEKEPFFHYYSLHCHCSGQASPSVCSAKVPTFVLSTILFASYTTPGTSILFFLALYSGKFQTLRKLIEFM